MQKNKQFYNITNIGNNVDCYVYGEIIGGSEKFDESDVVFDDIKSCMDTIAEGSNFNMYINSPGGSVFTTEAMINIIKRTKQSKNITVNAYIDGLGASCASWLPMVADNVYAYKGSIMMLHKPMSCAFGNADDMKKQIDILDKLENDTMIPLYMNKCKKTKEELKDMLTNETWLSADEMVECFDIELLDEEKQIVACVDKDLFKNYKNTPQELIEEAVKPVNSVENEPKIEDKQQDNIINEQEENKATEKALIEEKLNKLNTFIRIKTM